MFAARKVGHRLDAPAPAQALSALGVALATLGRFSEAVPVLETCVAAVEHLCEAQRKAGEESCGPSLCDALLNLAAVTDAAGRPEDAAELYRRAADAVPDSADGKVLKVECLVAQGGVFHRLGQMVTAEQVLDTAYELANQAAAEQRTMAAMRAQGHAAHKLASVLVDASRRVGVAVHLLRTSLALHDECGDGDGTTNGNEADALARLVALLHSRLPATSDDVDAALEAVHRNDAGSTPRAADEGLTLRPSDLALAAADACKRLRAHGAVDTAAQLMARALAVLTAALGEHDAEVAAAVDTLAAWHASAGRWVDAQPLYQRALAVAQAVAESAILDASGGDAATMAGCVPTGSALDKPSDNSAASTRGDVDDAPEVQHAASNLAACYEALERWDNAAELRIRVLKALDNAHTCSPSAATATAVAAAAHAAAACEEARGNSSEAKELYERALLLYTSTDENPDGVAWDAKEAYALPPPHSLQGLHLASWPPLAAGDPLIGMAPDVAAAAARTCNALALLHRSCGSPSSAGPLLMRSLALRHAARDGTDDLIVAWTNLAGVIRALGRPQDAVPLLTACVAACGNDAPVSGPSGPAHAALAVRAARAHHNLGAALRECGFLSDSLKHAARAVALWHAHLGGGHPHSRAASASADACIAALLQESHASPQPWLAALATAVIEAEQCGRPLEAMLLHTPIVSKASTAASETTHARLLLSLGRPADAVPYAERALAAAQAACAQLSNDDPAWLSVATAAAALGRCFELSGQRGAAVPHVSTALRVREQMLGPTHPLVGEALFSLGTLWETLARKDDAERCLRRALSIADKHCTSCPPQEAASAATACARALNALGLLLRSTGRAGEAKALLQRSLALREAVDAQPGDIAVAATNLASVHVTLNELDEASACYNRALGLWAGAASQPQSASEGDVPMTPGRARGNAAAALCNLGLIARRRGRFKEAAAFLERALAAWESGHCEQEDHEEAMAAAETALQALRSRHEGATDHDDDTAAALAAAAQCVSLLKLQDCGPGA